jgi:hypothetical protein
MAEHIDTMEMAEEGDLGHLQEPATGFRFHEDTA